LRGMNTVVVVTVDKSKGRVAKSYYLTNKRVQRTKYNLNITFFKVNTLLTDPVRLVQKFRCFAVKQRVLLRKN